MRWPGTAIRCSRLFRLLRVVFRGFEVRFEFKWQRSLVVFVGQEASLERVIGALVLVNGTTYYY